ncbi:MAG: ISKra4 family transposase [Anaerolineales bacterium]|nr:ISKra4 family transposase [Anaerolineales bacterium]MCA9951609.1 ISKra4 family transposase [Anaerolineales bacterium]
MTFNSNIMIPENIKSDLDLLLSIVTSEGGQKCTADQMERHLFKQLLCLGGKLMQLFFDIRSEAYPREKAVNQSDQTLLYHSEKSRSYHSIFGELCINRPYFYSKGQGGYSPLDAELGLGEDSYSDFLRELHDELGVHISFDKEVSIIERLLGISLSKRVVQQFIATDAADVAAYYEQKPPPPVTEEGAILVVQADGKGVPIIRASANKDKIRLKRGEARSKKKAVTATALYTIEPAPRTVEEVIASLLEQEPEKTSTSRSKPQHKQLWGTLAGKPAALDCLQGEVDKRSTDHSQQRVMLCDGDKSLQAHLGQRFPDFTLILDFIHAYEYLWQVASALYGQDDPQRLPWVVEQTRHLLNGQALSLATSFRLLAQEKGRSASQQKILRKVGNYFENNQDYMDYATYLHNGWPIASGVIEGVCRHFVKDRMELSGMRWSIDGAENLLHLRAVAENGDWDEYHHFRKRQRQQRLYQQDWPSTISLPSLSSLVRRSAKSLTAENNVSPLNSNQPYKQLPLAA